MSVLWAAAYPRPGFRLVRCPRRRRPTPPSRRPDATARLRHKCPLRSRVKPLPLLVLRNLGARHVQAPLALHDLTPIADPLDGGPDLETRSFHTAG